jgi:glycine/D-amino acid oxidase-like deaminating enzyme
VVFTPAEGYVEVVPFVGALLLQAARRGARLLPGRRVTSVLRSGSRVLGVTTDEGATLHAGVVVDCAGPAADEIARFAGVDLPLRRVPGRLVYTSPVASTLRRPIHAPGVHLRPDGAGRVVLADQAHDEIWQETGAPWPADQSLTGAATHLPLLAHSRVEAVRIGVRPMPTDGHPIVGAIPGLTGFYVVVSHSGVTLGPLLGRIAAAEILDGADDPRLAPYRAGRFL